MVTWVIIVTLAVLAVALVIFGVWAYQTANRLDRLHVRYDLSWQALDAALARRAVVARAVAIEAYAGGPQGRQLARLADAAERAPRSLRENAENELSAELALVDPVSVPVSLVAELADAEARVLLARRFHNDAVRDTLALRERSVVRLLRLGGRAPLPTYFEIVERAGAAARELGAMTRRASARVVLLDEHGAVLLLCGSDPATSDAATADPARWWFTVGGAVQAGESMRDAAAREIGEETGLQVDPAQLIGPVWRRDAVLNFNGAVVRSEETFFIHRTRRFEPATAGRSGLERSYIHDYRWCDAATIRDLAARGQTVYPLQLGELLAPANELADQHDRSGAAPTPEPVPIR